MKLRLSLHSFGRTAAGFTVAMLMLSINGCEGFYWNDDQLASEIRAEGPLRVGVLKHPLVYETSRRGAPRGMEYELLQNFGNHYQLKLKYIPFQTRADLTQALRRGEVDLAAGRFWLQSVPGDLLAGPGLEESHLSLYCHRRLKIEHLSDLKNKKVAWSQKDDVQSLKIRLQQFVPTVHSEVIPGISPRALFAKLKENETDCVVAENFEGAYFARANPLVEKVSFLTDDRDLGWLMRPHRSDLNELIKAWFQQASRDDEIMRIHDRSISALSQLNRNDVQAFLRNLRSKFPWFAKAFRESALEHDLDWKWVAAVAYQESHWEASAVSHTGVRGLMQLTSETAAYVGIEDRTDPLQSIWGGSFYLRSLLNMMPQGLEASERMALALAAYNSGIGHLKNAQTLAIERGMNPYSWKHLKKVYPLLEDPKIMAKLPFGTARGRETVAFVERVRAFHGLFHALN